MAVLHFYNNKFHKNEEEDNGLIAKNLESEIVEYSEIGLGKPLCVQIVNIYIGDAPSGFMSSKKDLLVVSGIKTPATFDASQKAINLLAKNVKNRTYLEPDDAFSKGTSIVYYTPALEASQMTFSFELVTESFNDKLATQIEGLFNRAAQMPLFVTSATTLVAGTGILNIVKRLGKAIFESKPFMNDSITARIDIGGFTQFKAGQKLICENGKESFFQNNCEIKSVVTFNGNQNYYLVDRNTGQRYNGDIPYIILNVDGRERRELASFQPKMASAAMISRFYGSDTQDIGFKMLETGMQLHSDLTYIKKIKGLKKELKGLGEEDVEKIDKLNVLIDAYKKNIQSEDLNQMLKLQEGAEILDED